ncbi:MULTISPECIES: 4Fe-4S binding protein [unclassified Lebetimonas]|uniref:4Fe-4S binding protein n=1 Tax=unclassified Lebetimonas TaxID=2648158 RepID=UPI0004646DF0|nr:MULTISPECIES: 4Fe-4S binding protein [unclassified Lebetimonas]
MINRSKRNFFRRISSPKSFIYPPYYEKKEDFLTCIECDEKACVNSCPEKIIELNNDIPVLNFAFNGCTFCDECARACGKVLKLEYKKDKINAQFLINYKKCLAWNNIICYSCQDICEKNAIIYKEMFNPVIDLKKCNGCGFCIGVCPNDSIEIIIK